MSRDLWIVSYFVDEKSVEPCFITYKVINVSPYLTAVALMPRRLLLVPWSFMCESDVHLY